MLPAERTDVIIDFSNCAGQEITLINADTDFSNEHTNVIMQFRVTVPLKCEDTSDIPERLAVTMDLHTHHAHIERQLPLTATTDEFGRPMLLLNDRMYHDPATEKPSLDSVEIWNFINATPFLHPIHLHLIQFKILERRPFNLELYQNEGIIEFTGPPEEPRDYERGWKDTVKADAGKVTKIIMHWKDHIGHYMWHCHFLEHEDHDMMRPILVMKDVHAVQQPHAAIEHPAQHQEATATTNPTETTSTTHHNESPAPLLNAIAQEEESAAPTSEKESLAVHVGNNAQFRPPLLFPFLPTQAPTNRQRRHRARRF